MKALYPYLSYYKKYKNKFVIYMLANPINQIYIGASKNVVKRLTEHSQSKNSGVVSLIGDSIRLYEFENHVIEILWESDNIIDLYKMEEFYIKKYNSCSLDNENGLNLRRSVNDNEHCKIKMSTNKQVHKYELLSGRYLDSYISIHNASESINNKNGYKNISSCCYGKRRYAYNFYWSFDKLDFFKPEKTWKNKKLQKVYRFFKDGSLIQDVYESISEAAHKNNLTSLQMFRVIYFNKIVNNSIFVKQ